MQVVQPYETQLFFDNERFYDFQINVPWRTNSCWNYAYLEGRNQTLRLARLGQYPFYT